MLIVSMRDRKIMRRELDGSLVAHADLSSLAPWHLNDMLVDHSGRAWVGNFGFDLTGGAEVATTNLICVDPDGRAAVATDGLGFPNGMVLTAEPQHINCCRNADESTERLRRRLWCAGSETDLGGLRRSANVNQVHRAL